MSRILLGLALAALLLFHPLSSATAATASVPHHSGSVALASSHGGWHGGWHGGIRVYGGWGWYSPWWGWGWGWPYYGYGYPYYRHYGESYGPWTAVKTDVEPDEAALYLDGKLIGTADDFDGYPDRLYLGRGHYRLEFRLDGYETYTTEIDAAPGRSFRVDEHLKRIPGAHHYGTYRPARPEGGVVRFYAKRGSVDEPQSPYSYSPERRSGTYREDSGEDVEPEEPGSPGEPAPAAPELSESRLYFDIEPAEAAVYIDGHFAGGARDLNSMTEGFAIAPGQHHVTVTCPGYRESTLNIDAGTGKNPRVRLRLSR